MQKNNFIWAIALVLVSVSAIGQTGTSSPYSIGGLGELKPQSFAQHQALGGASISLQDNNSFSLINPASYTNLEFTVFDAGARMTLGQLSTESLEANTRSGNFNYFAMAFPFETKRKMALSFGTNQYSDVGYEIINRVNTDTPSYYNLFSGSGGINRVYLGYGVEVAKNLNFGINFNYNFGSIQSAKAKIYPNSDNRFSHTDEDYMSYRGIDIDLGMQYSVYQNVQSKTNDAHRIKHTLGAAFNTGASLRGTGYRYSETFFGRAYEANRTLPIDTVLFDDNVKDTATKPVGISVGYTVSNGDKWALSLEMQQNKWSGVTDRESGNNFFDNTRYSVGFSIRPNTDYSTTGNYLKKVAYRIGGRYENLYYNFNNTQLNEIGISFGLGLPVVKSVRLEEEKVAVVNMINITAEYMTRGTTQNGLIQEDYINITLGLNLNDKWFTKRKYR